MRFRVHLPEGTSVWESNAALFRVGRGDTCALRFEGLSAKYASWEHAEFRVGDDGAAYIIDLGSSNGTYVDGVRIANSAPLRCGSAIQIGNKGPCIEVLDLPPPSAQRMLAPIPVATVPAQSERPVPRPAAGFQRRGVVVGLSVALLVVIGFALVRGNALPEPRAALPPIPENPNERARGDDDSPKPAPPNPLPPIEHREEDASDAPPVLIQPPDAGADAREQGMAAYRLLVVQDPETESSYPLAGAAVVGPNALLTSADVGVVIARFLERGWRVSAVRDPLEAGVPIDRVRVHAAFQDAEPDHQLFFDMGLAFAKERLDGAATLASAAELAEIELGQEVACIATDHSDEAIDHFQGLKPEWYLAKAIDVTPLSPDGEAPQLLRIRGGFSEKFSGSPIFNKQGHLIAIYCEAAPAPENVQADRAYHFATVIEPQLIERGLSGSESPNWVAPILPPQQAAEEEPGK